ncbi:UDP-2,3-diacylglucosamine diphosphatase [Campylobacter sp. RM9344]|uniref:UDP-2,3-diacylglucosamine diphosphatase n=1 Tax=Campylobacter californiensis TaxID=1032243 RepID=A0AAW3ZS13_9BACT|nr:MULTISPECIES: UDP-2,3-diacylglucosamine diphosphatase [unclassified Campylobacter]MBE2984142.1 UDP-2,3-diacylglucosamine diphosphatase [Campylobacter sp. RM6883]MBE2986234.1 UDP-2,3-diacylglucosamine diphosphatase [Campylobacter sp. RM12919]MBE2988231.1 UDP-2,3-diacylglucosamine diphosphatase [Campylobacter sp. RM12920]MBE2995512.1 UDP-2,3-diacylglucosamine diphosphatase [Campylobacter sp. RM6913]MBE3022611.1 UDP-2,3-diacylglucosamine diphosphatase [Campylobacter sp. 7477a]MBE3030329.1 UDP
MIIKNGAIFISDAHENVNRDDFLRFLQSFDRGEISAPQLFLMGDMFDFLAAHAKNTVKFYEKHIELINKIALKTEVIYIEGNHDFVLSSLFKNVKVFPISAQPVNFKTELAQSVQIAHGDNFLPFVSKYALLFLRLEWFLMFMNFIDILCGFKISNWILNRLTVKKLDYKISNFKAFISPKMRHYSADIVIEGHYHQGEIFDIGDKIYVNLPAFACDQSYFIVEYRDEKINFARKSLKGH